MLREPSAVATPVLGQTAMVRRHVCVRRVCVSFDPTPVSFPEAVDKWGITESKQVDLMHGMKQPRRGNSLIHVGLTGSIGG
jgi:hypothetical protein